MATFSTSGNMYVAGTILASGFLDSENVVFYHPLDNPIDGIQGDVWAGSAAFRPAIITSGIGSIYIGSPSVSAPSEFPAINKNGYGDWIISSVNDSNQLIYLTNHDHASLRSQVINVAGDVSTVGTADILTPVSGWIPLTCWGQSHCIHLSGSRYVGSITISDLPDYLLMVATFDIAGDTITWNPESYFYRTDNVTTGVGIDHHLAAIPNDPSGGFLLVECNGIATNQDSTIHYCRGYADGTTSLESTTILPSGTHSQIVVLDSSKAVMTYRSTERSRNEAVIINISGTTLTFETPVEIDPDSDFWLPGPSFTNYQRTLEQIDGSGFIAGYIDFGPSALNNVAWFVTHVVSGTTISTVSSGSSVCTPTCDTTSLEVTWDSANAVGMYHYLGHIGVADERRSSCGFITVDDDYNISVGSRSDYAGHILYSHAIPSKISTIGNGNFLGYVKLGSFGNTKKAYVIGPASNSISGQKPAAYLSATGASGLTLACWTNMSNISGSLLSVGRDCDIDIASEYISLGGSGTLYWNDTAILDLIDQMNVANDHFMVVDFRYQGSNDWNLHTSVNGSGWVDHGIQNSGSQGLITESSTPAISFSENGSADLLDEVILWKDVDLFTVKELLQLYELGNTFDSYMALYESTEFIYPFSISKNLFISGPIQSTGSCDLFISGPSETSTGISGYLYWSDQGSDKIQSSLIDGSGVNDLQTGLNTPKGLDIHAANSQIYWTDPVVGYIRRCNFDGSNVVNVASGASANTFQGIHVDPINNYLYTAGNPLNNSHISRRDLDGSNVVQLISITGSSPTVESPLDVVVDVANNKLYWTAGESADQTTVSGYIGYSNLDGSSSGILVNNLNPVTIALDSVNDKLYWSNWLVSNDGEIQRCDLDGSNVETIVTGLNRVHGFAIDNANMYLAEIIQGTISSGNLDGTGMTIIVSGLTNPQWIAVNSSFPSGPSSGLVPSGTTFRIINKLTKGGIYNPQLISAFDVSPSSVNIQLWDIVDAQNTPVIITNSGCYPIGNTDWWGWSTEYLPFTGEKKKYQYYYRMISNTGEEQCGEFFIIVPERGRWSYPD